MMMWIIGVALFALFILVSVALHECGHMWAARATGMKVRRYFVGFGPTLWSTYRPNKLGYTEYGVKGMGEGGAIAPPAAIANAVRDALASLGAEVNETPLTPRRVLAAIRRAQRGP